MYMRAVMLTPFFLIPGLLFLATHFYALDIPFYSFGETGSVFAEEKGARALFVGDILLARAVERTMEQHGAFYPFERIHSFTEGMDVSIGNFEAPIPEEHEQTPAFEVTFSVKQEYLSQLTRAGFDSLSLANNHTLDRGEGGYRHTREACVFYNINCFGHPTTIDTHSATYHDLDDVRMGVLGLNATTKGIQEMALGAMLSKMDFYSDIQIVFVHWGEEYTSRHSKKQEDLARALIENGADAVIGHHPHVVQSIEIYQGKPIFYSLGNFIFDQYFSPEVQEGLGVVIHPAGGVATYELYGFTSVDSRSQPRRMSEKETHDMLSSLSILGTSEIQRSDITAGHFKARY